MPLKYFFLIGFFGFVFLNAQTNITPEDYKVFEPNTELDLKINDQYNQNFFFGLFGVKALINALPANVSNVKTLKVYSNLQTGKDRKPAYVVEFNKSGKPVSILISGEIGTETEIKYTYKDGLIASEKVSSKKEQYLNNFFYKEDKMIVEKHHGLMDFYGLDHSILLRNSFLEGKGALKDRLNKNCRITSMVNNQEDINQVCYSNIDNNLPLKVTEYITAVDQKTKKEIFQESVNREILKVDNSHFAILVNKEKLFEIDLNEKGNISHFNYLGEKQKKQAAISFSFEYAYY